MNLIEKQIDKIIDRVNLFKIEPNFENDYNERVNRKILRINSESELLKIFVRLIAFSSQAKSDLVKDLINRKTLDKVFANYNVELVAKMNPCDLVDAYWEECTVIRQRTKFFQIVMFARLIKRNKSVLSLLTNPNLPISIKSLKHIDDFWIGFKELQTALKDVKAPFLRETTTLLHFLLDNGYYCIKPDSAVMKASLNLKIVDKVSGETNFIKAVKFFQNYAFKMKIKPAVLDLYLLIDGKQKDAQKLVSKKYYLSK